MSTKILATPAAITAREHCAASWLFLLPLVLIVPLAAGALALRGNFDGLYGQDPYAYYNYAVGPLRQSLLRLEAPPSFYWPPGYPLLVALASFVVGTAPLAGQLVSLLCGALVPFLTALLAHEVWSVRQSSHQGAENSLFVPLVAGLVAAFHGQLWQSSTTIMSDTAGLAAATLGIWALARYGQLGTLRWLLLAAGAVAYSVLVRWPLAPLALPAAAYALVVLSRLEHRRALFHGMAAALLVGLVLGPLLFATLAGVRGPNGDGRAFGSSFEVFSWNPLNALRRDFVTLEGYYHYKLPVGLYYAIAPARSFAFTPLLAAFVLPGLYTLARSRTVQALLLLVGWAGVIYLFLAGFAYQNFRYTLAYVPPIAILIAIGFGTAREATRGRVNGFLSLVLVAGLAWMAVGGVELTRDFIERKQLDLAAVRWTESQLPPDARLLTFGITLAFEHYTALETVEFYNLNADDLTRLASDGQPTFLLLELDSIEQQWRDRPPSENYHWLRDNAGLEPIGQHAPYTLFRVGGVTP
jgi:hypothetical protein